MTAYEGITELIIRFQGMADRHGRLVMRTLWMVEVDGAIHFGRFCSHA